MGLQDTIGSRQLSATVVAQCSEFDRAQHNKLPITEGPSLMFSILKVACDQTQPGSLLARPRR